MLDSLGQREKKKYSVYIIMSQQFLAGAAALCSQCTAVAVLEVLRLLRIALLLLCGIFTTYSRFASGSWQRRRKVARRSAWPLTSERTKGKEQRRPPPGRVKWEPTNEHLCWRLLSVLGSRSDLESQVSRNTMVASMHAACRLSAVSNRSLLPLLV